MLIERTAIVQNHKSVRQLERRTSTKAKQSPLIQSRRLSNKTYSNPSDLDFYLNPHEIGLTFESAVYIGWDLWGLVFACNN